MLRFLLEKEFKQIIRNPFLMGLIFIFPIVIMLVMPQAADLDVKNINVSIVDNDHSSYSRRMVDKIGALSYFTIVNVSETYDDALVSIEDNKADVIVQIEPGFERKLIRDNNAETMITANAVDGIKSGLSTTYLSTVLISYANELRGEWIQTKGMSKLPMIEVLPQNRYNIFLNYKIYMIPALFVILLTLLCGFLPALNIVGEKEAGTIDQMNVTPVKKIYFILAKLIPYWLIGIIVLTLCIILGYLLYGLIPSGNIWLIYMVSGLFFISISGIGLIVSNFADNMQQAMFIMFLVVMIMIIMSGLFTPIASMPKWAQMVTQFIPLTYYAEALRMIYLKGSTISELIQPIFIIITFGIVLYIGALLTYKKTN